MGSGVSYLTMTDTLTSSEMPRWFYSWAFLQAYSGGLANTLIRPASQRPAQKKVFLYLRLRRQSSKDPNSWAWMSQLDLVALMCKAFLPHHLGTQNPGGSQSETSALPKSVIVKKLKVQPGSQRSAGQLVQAVQHW
mmetsp:Transcript_109360/g.193717  ORF Transcript_109360/g.193717 Transcript_109360/m.193717 type:complete len:136 (+) Transcript_109360:21-428(+)